MGVATKTPAANEAAGQPTKEHSMIRRIVSFNAYDDILICHWFSAKLIKSGEALLRPDEAAEAEQHGWRIEQTPDVKAGWVRVVK
jgi:hypothetical protein